MATLLCCMSSNAKDNKAKKQQSQQVVPEERRQEPVVIINIDEPSVDNVIIQQQESTSNLHAATVEYSNLKVNQHINDNSNPPGRPSSNLAGALHQGEGDVRASTNSQVLMTQSVNNSTRKMFSKASSSMLLDEPAVDLSRSVQLNKNVSSTKLEPSAFEKKTKLHCGVACMGKFCKHENWQNCAKPYIQGLHSEIVLDMIVGSCRLNDKAIKEFNMIKQMKDKNIVAVFNLQEPGEHPYCGEGIIPKIGYSYNPELLMNAGISYFNMYWKDLKTPEHETTMKIIQLMHHFIIQGGEERRNKVLVHCHAGQGRTAIIIGAYILFAGLCDNSTDTIKICREGRPKLFTNVYNQHYLKQFEKYLKEVRNIYPLQDQQETLRNIIKKQRLILQGLDSDIHRHLPKVINQCLLRMKQLFGQDIPYVDDFTDSIMLPRATASKTPQVAKPKRLVHLNSAQHTTQKGPGFFDAEAAKGNAQRVEEMKQNQEKNQLDSPIPMNKRVTADARAIDAMKVQEGELAGFSLNVNPTFTPQKPSSEQRNQIKQEFSTGGQSGRNTVLPETAAVDSAMMGSAQLSSRPFEDLEEEKGDEGPDGSSGGTNMAEQYKRQLSAHTKTLIRQAQAAFFNHQSEMITEKIVKAREQINRGNWRAIKETDDIALLVGVVIDFIGKIQTSSIFENNLQLQVLMEHIKKVVDAEEGETVTDAKKRLLTKSQMKTSDNTLNSLEQYHLGFIILMADFIHLVFGKDQNALLGSQEQDYFNNVGTGETQQIPSGGKQEKSLYERACVKIVQMILVKSFWPQYQDDFATLLDILGMHSDEMNTPVILKKLKTSKSIESTISMITPLKSSPSKFKLNLGHSLESDAFSKMQLNNDYSIKSLN